MNVEELEELLADVLEDVAPNFSIAISEEGEVIILTGLVEDEEGDLVEGENLENEYEENEDDEKEDEEEDEE